MRFVTFKARQPGSPIQVGIRQGDTIATVESGGRSLKAMLASSNGDLTEFTASEQAPMALSNVELLPPIPAPGKIFCIGLNYHAHRIETGNVERDFPTVFSRFATCLTGHNQDVWRPRVSTKMDFEGELAVVIGQVGHHVDESDAMSIVGGFSCFNDISIRDWQRHTSQFTPGKNFMNTGAFGPELVTPDEVGNPESLTLCTRLNGEEVQRTTTDLMIFPIPKLISYISTFTRLEPGDVIVTGTPGGVGVKRSPPLFMQPGDVVEVEISKVGLLRNTVVDEPIED